MLFVSSSRERSRADSFAMKGDLQWFGYRRKHEPKNATELSKYNSINITILFIGLKKIKSSVYFT